jgi:hypothetical protein
MASPLARLVPGRKAEQRVWAKNRGPMVRPQRMMNGAVATATSSWQRMLFLAEDPHPADVGLLGDAQGRAGATRNGARSFDQAAPSRGATGRRFGASLPFPRRSGQKALFLRSFGWCCRGGLNSRPLPYQGSALPLSYGSECTGAKSARERRGKCHTGVAGARIGGPNCAGAHTVRGSWIPVCGAAPTAAPAWDTDATTR